MRADIALFLAVTALAGCGGSGDEFLLQPSSDAPAVADYGMLDVIPADEWNKLGPQEAIDTYGYHGTIGAPESGHFGGGTFRFTGTGDDVCVLTDMELVFWGQSISPIQPVANYQYSDNYNDDGDIGFQAGEGMLLVVRLEGPRREHADAGRVGKLMDRGLALLHAASGGPGRLRVDGSHLMAGRRDCRERRDGEFRRTHEDDAQHRLPLPFATVLRPAQGEG